MSISVKIVSNPYAKTVEFYRMDGGWQPINPITDPSSPLLNSDLVKGFFPFKAKEIVNRIVGEFHVSGQNLAIMFEGSDDEYEELQAVCDDAEYQGFLALERSDRRLPNARDVLPEIVEIFRGIRPLIDECVMEKEKVTHELEKFYDVSSDLIPLCVLGNCSAGKSTFINALIGFELLPNGDEPVTAKVFQIKRSKQRDRGSIRFSYGNTPFLLRFNDTGLAPNDELENNPFYQSISKAIEKTNLEGLIGHMNCILRILNGFKARDGEANVSDLIEIVVPFCMADPWAQSNEFVIFDTPGSNSASNEDHARVLREAMEGLSNGLPIYIAESTSLDSKDNEKLYDEISQIEAMDERFAMIVVNKADSASLPKNGFSAEDVEEILDQVIPRSLYAQGIYYTSSILGLGSKIQGEFVNDYYAEKFDDQKRKYSNPEDRFYKMLYRYNILPGQIGERTIAESEKCPDLVFANSGLYCIEQEIVLFAERYSAYNKCHQSEGLLRRVIDITSGEIEAAKARREQSKKNREEALDRDKRELISNLEARGEGIELSALEQYPPHVSETVDFRQWRITEEQLRAREAVLTDENKDEHNYDAQNQEAQEAQKAVWGNFTDNFFDALSNPEKGKFSSALSSFFDDVDIAENKRRAAAEAARDADRETSDELLAEVRALFDDSVKSIEGAVDDSSKAYWSERAELGRTVLYELATSSTVLSEEKRQEVAEIIIKYPQLSLVPNAESIFVKSELMKDFKIWNLVIVSSNKLNLGKLSRVYNAEIERAYREIRESTRCNHEVSFKDWLAELLGLIVDNITDYNPILHNHAEIIREDTEKINELTAKLDTLERCTAQVTRMIDWRG